MTSRKELESYVNSGVQSVVIKKGYPNLLVRGIFSSVIVSNMN